MCAVLQHSRGPARLRDLINLVEAVSAVSGKHRTNRVPKVGQLGDLAALSRLYRAPSAMASKKITPSSLVFGALAIGFIASALVLAAFGSLAIFTAMRCANFFVGRSHTELRIKLGLRQARGVASYEPGGNSHAQDQLVRCCCCYVGPDRRWNMDRRRDRNPNRCAC